MSVNRLPTMSLIRSTLTRLSAYSGGLRFSIVIAMCAGLLLPALIGSMVLTHLRLEQVNKDVVSHLDDRIRLLASSLFAPVMYADVEAARRIAEALLLDPQVVRVTVTDAEQNPVLNIERPERRLGESSIAQHNLSGAGTVIGQVELETDDGLKLQEFRQDRREYFLVFMVQFLLALLLIMIAIRRRVLWPLARLTAFSNQVGDGNLERPLDWRNPDEIGRLAQQLDQMRSNLRTSFAEQHAILSNVQVGVVFVRERTILLANRQTEEIFGYPAGAMRGHSSRNLLSVRRAVHLGRQTGLSGDCRNRWAARSRNASAAFRWLGFLGAHARLGL